VPLRQIPGMTPSLLNLPVGCSFRARCPRAAEDCIVMPDLHPWLPDRLARCHHPHLEEAVTA
jgi:peptide/nickel transport system ATP-binding protein